MRRPSPLRFLGNLLAVVIIVVLVGAGIEWLGYDLGWRSWIACFRGGWQDLFNLIMVVGVGLLFFRGARSAGAGFLLLALAGGYVLELYIGGYSGACMAPYAASPARPGYNYGP